MSTATLLDAAWSLLAGSWELSPEEAEERLVAFLAESTDKLAALRAVAKASEAIAVTHKSEADIHMRRIRAARATGERVSHLAFNLLAARRELGEEPSVPGVARIQRNGGVVPLVYADRFDPAELPAELQRVSIEADAEAIRAALERGEAVPGVCLGERGESLRWS